MSSAAGKAEFRIATTPSALAELAAAEFVQAALAAVRQYGRFSVALAGGSTPMGLYRLLARRGHLVPPGPLPWGQIHLFWGDERQVPPDHADSNYGAVRTALLERVAIPPGNVHRIQGQLADAEAVAALYEQEIRTCFGLGPDGWPRFDLVLLGMGADGHTASLFPHTTALAERNRIVAANWVPKLSASRITLTLPAINAAARVVFLVAGADKAATVARVLTGPANPVEFPAQAVQPGTGMVLWLLDRAAAAALPAGSVAT